MFDSLVTDFTLNSSGFTRGATRAQKSMDSLSDKAQSVGRSMQSVGKSMSMFVTLPLAAAGAAAVKTASDVEEMQSKMSVVFGELESDIRQWSATHAKEVERSKFQLQEYATALQDTFVPMGFARDEAAKMSMQLSELAIDLASFNNMSEQQALDRLRSGLIGNHEALREFGVMINQTTLEQELMNQGMAESVQEATEMQKVMARLAIIQRSTADAQGDAARTADSFANQMRGLKADARALGVTIGKELMPTARALVDTARSGIKWFQDLSATQQKLAVGFAAVAAAAGPVLFFAGSLLALLPAMASGFAMVSAASLPVTAPILAIAGAFAVLGAAYATNFMGIADKTRWAAGVVKDNLGLIKTGILALIGPIGWAYMAWESNFLGIQNVTADGVSWIRSHLNLLVDGLLMLMGPVGWLAVAWRRNLFGMRDVATEVFGSIVDGAMWAIGVVTDLPEKLKQAVDMIPGVDGEEVANTLFPPKPTQDTAMQTGKNTGSDFVRGGREGLEAAASDGQDTMDATAPSEKQALSAGQSTGQQFAEGAVAGAGGGTQEEIVAETTPAIRKALKNGVEGYVSDPEKIGDKTAMSQKLFDTIASQQGGATAKRLGVSEKEFAVLMDRFAGGSGRSSATSSSVEQSFASSGSPTSGSGSGGGLDTAALAEAVRAALEGLGIEIDLETDDPTLKEIINERVRGEFVQQGKQSQLE